MGFVKWAKQVLVDMGKATKCTLENISAFTAILANKKIKSSRWRKSTIITKTNDVFKRSARTYYS